MLRDTGFLANASPVLMAVLEEIASQTSLQKGKMLFSQGDTGDAFYVVTSGALEVSVISAEGRRLSLCVMRQGEGLGEISLFDPSEVRTATATAIEPTELLRVDGETLRRKVASNPELAVELLRLAGRRMRWMSGQISEQALLPLAARLARRLLYLTARHEDFTLQMSHARLADFVGATREAVSRLLSDWKRDGHVELSRGGIRVADRDALENIAETGLL